MSSPPGPRSAAGLEARCSARRPGGLGRRLAVRRSRTRVAEDDGALRTADTVTADEIERIGADSRTAPWGVRVRRRVTCSPRRGDRCTRGEHGARSSSTRAAAAVATDGTQPRFRRRRAPCQLAVRRRAPTTSNNSSASAITAYLSNGDTLEHAQHTGWPRPRCDTSVSELCSELAWFVVSGSSRRTPRPRGRNPSPRRARRRFSRRAESEAAPRLDRRRHPFAGFRDWALPR